MGKRSSNFKRRARDFYPTPLSAVLPLLPHLMPGTKYWEPCAGDGALIDCLSGHADCVVATDIEPHCEGIHRLDAMVSPVEDIACTGVDCIITNPPWDRKILHPMIGHFVQMRPTWLLFDADWMHTKQATRFMPVLRSVISVGRVKWIEGSKNTGKDNAAWYLFDKMKDHRTPPQFWGRQ